MKTFLKNNLLPLAMCAAIVIIYSLSVHRAHGQTNTQQIVNSQIVADAETYKLPPNIKADLVKLFSDILDSISFSGLSSAGFIAWVSARLLRKGVPDAMQTGIVGTILKHAALEINPAQTPTPSNVTDQKVILADTATGAKIAPESVKP